MVRATRNTRWTPRADKRELRARLRQQQPARAIEPADFLDLFAIQFAVELAGAAKLQLRAADARVARRAALLDAASAGAALA